MFADQIDTVTVVIYLSRPQMAILDLMKSQPTTSARPWITCPRSARRNEAIATENHDAARIQRNQACVRLGSSVPNELSGH